MANCPGCQVDVPQGLPEDTLFLGAIPDGMANAYYDQDVSFRMPKTSTPVSQNDPDVPSGLNIAEITIVGISNLPPGLSWEANASSYSPQDETDGCLKFCGTPLVPGLYVMEVTIEAVVFIVTEEVTFDMEVYIAPAMSNNDGFSLVNNSGCGMVTTSFENNVVSNGNAGYRYNWDFGNGNSSLDENPSDQTYDTPGTYIVNYQATIDTTGYILTRVGVIDVDCSDIPTGPVFSNKPDLQVEIEDPSGVRIYESERIDNVDGPVDYFPNILIESGTYRLKVIDEDSGINGGDDTCIDINFNLLSNGTITGNGFELELDIFNPIDTISTTDTITVYAIPDAPVLVNLLEDEFCDGSTTTLTSSYLEGNQWFFEGEAIVGATADSFEVLESGMYQVQYTSVEGCTAISEAITITINELPEIPTYSNTNNLLTLASTIVYDPEFTLQWYQDGELLIGETTTEFCALEDGEYTLEVTDPTTGCTNVFTQTIDHDGSLDCFTSAEDLVLAFDLSIFPNPVNDWINISLSTKETMTLGVKIYDIMGRVFYHNPVQQEVYGTTQLSPISVENLAPGMYFIELRLGEETMVQKFIRG